MALSAAEGDLVPLAAVLIHAEDADIADLVMAAGIHAAGDIQAQFANVGLLTDIIACPGGDFCALANAKSIPIAQGIQARFEDLDYLHDLGDISLNISGCMNACGHHHIGNIGILGVDKNGSEWYQITLGGAQGKNSALGKVIGPSFSAAEVPAVIEQIIDTFVRYRESEEVFVDTFQRIGLEPFKEAVYPKVLEVSA